MKHLLNWNVGFCDGYGEEPKKYFAASVPGAVQLDYAKEYGLPDYNRGLNFEQYKPLEDLYWVYTAEYDAANAGGKKLFLIVKGIDYSYEIYANGERLGKYMPADLNDKQAEEYVLKALTYYKKHLDRKAKKESGKKQ